MSNWLFQNSGYVIQAISLCVIIGFLTLTFPRSHTQGNTRLSAQRQATLRVLGGVFLSLAIILVGIMLLIGFQKKGATFPAWALVFLLVTVAESAILTLLVRYLARRQVKRVLER